VLRPRLDDLPVIQRGSILPDRELLAQGALLLADKPDGKSSFWLVRLLRALSKVKKIGHAGTLDPFATGLVILLIGKNATRLQAEVMAGDKRYLARLRLGVESDSHDRTGSIVASHAGPLPDRQTFEKLLPDYRGEQQQIPPMFSAISVGGKRLYKLARKGETVVREPRPVMVHSLDLVTWDPPYVELDLRCAKGYYVRSLARDLGRALGCGALLEDLRRLESGSYSVENALSREGLEELFAVKGS
jgi:tRNA pseudouridine55 synthase